MKPAPFDYVRAESIDEICALLADDEDARIIAGGQTLTPMLAMRLSRPSKLVDILRVPGLAGIREDGDAIAIGATTRQVDVERSALVAAKLPLLAQAIVWVGHPPTRNRGTVGGSIANADPSAEIPLVAVTLEAKFVVQESENETQIPAGVFFFGPMITAIPAGGCITGVRFPIWSGRVGAGFHEISARRGDFALVSAAAQVELDEEGACLRCAVGIGGAAEAPVLLEEVGKALVGSKLGDEDVKEAALGATAGLDVMSDLHASAEYRRRVAGTLARRAVQQARDEARRAAA